MANDPPPELHADVTWRPGEHILGYLPNVFSMVISVSGGRGVRREDMAREMVERPTDLVVTDQRVLGYKYEEAETGFFSHARKFRPRFGLNLENIQEIRLKDNRLEFMGELTGMGLATLYLILGSSQEAVGLAQWTESARKERREALASAQGKEVVQAAMHERRPGGGWSVPPPPAP